MENSLKGLILAAGIVITCLVIGVGFYVSREAKSASVKATGQINEITSELDEPAKVMYDDAVVSGREVCELIGKYCQNTSDKMVIKVATLEAPDTYSSYGWIDDESVAYTQNKPNQADYINPAGKFLGKVERNASGIITGIQFTQQ